jgi:hypothetical protein
MTRTAATAPFWRTGAMRPVYQGIADRCFALSAMTGAFNLNLTLSSIFHLWFQGDTKKGKKSHKTFFMFNFV